MKITLETITLNFLLNVWELEMSSAIAFKSSLRDFFDCVSSEHKSLKRCE